MPDLSAAAALVEANVMVDQCRVTRDVQGTGDDVFDEESMTLSPPSNDTTTIYTGKCSILPMNLQSADAVSAGIDEVTSTYRIGLPLLAPVVLRGDTVTCTVSTRDAQLVGRKFRVKSSQKSSFAVWRLLTAVLIESTTGVNS
jgi:uncharacterized protein DUF6093